MRPEPSAADELNPSSTEPPPAAAVAARSILRLGRHLSHALDDIGLSPAQYRVLAMLAEGDAMASRVAGQMAVTKPSITALIDGLAERGLVERRSHPTDRRRRTLCITSDGIDRLAEADATASARLADIAQHLSNGPQELETLARWDEAIRAYRAEQHAATTGQRT